MKYEKQYGLFYKSNKGTIWGFVERSFSMGWVDGEVRLWDAKAAQDYLKSFSKECPEISFFVLRITRKNLPYNMKIRWQARTHKNNVVFSGGYSS